MVSREKKKKNQPHYHILVGTIFKKTNYKDFPGGQWLRLYASSVGGVYLVSGWGTKISYASQLSQNKKRKQTKWKSLSRVWLFATPMDYTAHGILQARILEWVAFLFSRGSSTPGIKPRSPALQAVSLLTEPPGKPKTNYRYTKLITVTEKPTYKEEKSTEEVFRMINQLKRKWGERSEIQFQFQSESESEVAQSCQTLRDPVDRSLPGSSIHGIFQARVLEWGAIAFSNSKICTIRGSTAILGTEDVTKIKNLPLRSL